VRDEPHPATLAALKAQGRKALIPYVTAGDPFADATPDIMHALAEGGADIIELGVPFSDPMADGPVIQKASERALARHRACRRCWPWCAAFVSATPHARGADGLCQPGGALRPGHGGGSFIRDAAAAGVDGLLVVDYPPEECEAFAAQLKAVGLDLIFLLAPTSTDERMREVGRIASGYVYYVSLKGVTGAGHLDTTAVAQMLPRIRAHVQRAGGRGFWHPRRRHGACRGRGGRRGGDRLAADPDSGSRDARQCAPCRPGLHGRNPRGAGRLNEVNA
jgi:tryptophan synthase alpha chain